MNQHLNGSKNMLEVQMSSLYLIFYLPISQAIIAKIVYVLSSFQWYVKKCTFPLRVLLYKKVSKIKT